ncbi:MAG: thiamine pyrophosphate-dependent enzyme [Acidobacteriota bacterium]|nr:thiamine pyrophosphate-dependent enzyme [Acidobacteriota bacterium]
MPHQKLRQIYVAMVEARLLDEHIKGLKGAKRPRATRGEEACRVSTAIDLGSGDAVSDSHAGVGMELLAGAKVTSLLGRVVQAKDKGRTKADGGGDSKHGPWVMPWTEDAGERLKLAMGTALVFRKIGAAKVVAAYVAHADARKGEWRGILKLASKLELPIFFVVLPDGRRGKKKDFGRVAKRAGSCGVPGMVVDANDAVALYRVAQETLGRARGGGGPVLIECVSVPQESERGEAEADPLDQMRNFLRGRKIATDTWLEQAAASFHRKLAGRKS